MNREILVKILDLARWAPSGDNTQPWRFQVVSDEHIAVHGFDTREAVLYDFDGQPSQMAHGALLETLRIAATAFELDAQWQLRPASPDRFPVYDVKLRRIPGLATNPLFPQIEKRVVQRRPMRTTALTASQKDSLAKAPGPGFAVQFFESATERFGVARMLWDNAYIRLTCPEAYKVHREIIEWGARYSDDRLPEAAVGIDPVTAKLMKWVLARWSRVEFFNRYLLGTVPPRLQLDFTPAMACAAHLLILPTRPPEGRVAHVAAGVAMQRLWLTASALGLHLQPEMTPVIFRWYARAGRKVSALPGINHRVGHLASRFETLANVSAEQDFSFFCRVGVSRPPTSRSLRLAVKQLLISE